MARRIRTSLICLGLVVAVLVGSGTSGDASAEFRSAIKRGTGACPAGWTVDPLRAECYRCPAGYSRTVLPLDALACERPAAVVERPATRYRRGTGLLKTDCPKGQFWNLNGYCYSCPAGSAPTLLPVASGPACEVLRPPGFAAAQWRRACPVGSFRDLGRGDCWSCPANFIRTAAPVTSPNACASDVTGILGTDPRGMCASALAAVEEGGAIAGDAQAAVKGLMSPLMKPIDDGIKTIAGQFRTPARFERLMERLAAGFRTHRPFLDDFQDWAGRVANARSRLLRLMLDPAVACDGDLARVNRELSALDLWPRSGRTAPAPDGLVFNVLRRPFPIADSGYEQQQTPRGYLVVALELGLPIASVVKGVGSLSVVWDRLQPIAVLGSGGGSLGWPQPPSGGLGLSVLYFPAAVPDDFLQMGALGTQFNVEVGTLAETVFEVLGGVKAKVPIDFAVSFDAPAILSAVQGTRLTRFPAGMGLSGTFQLSRKPSAAAGSGGTQWETASSRSISSNTSNADWDMTSLSSTTSATSNAEWKPRSQRIGELFVAFLKRSSVSVDWTGRILPR